MKFTFKISFLYFFICILFLLFSFSSSALTKIKIVSITNFSEVENLKMKKISENLEKVINSNDFKIYILDHSMNKQKNFLENNNKNNHQIYFNIMSGEEVLNPVKDNEWQLHLNKKFILSRSTLAYTDKKQKEIHFSSRYIENGDDASISGTICHEYAHKLGYGHDTKNTKQWPYTVPYAVGDICTSLYVNLFPGRPVNTVKEPYCGILCRLKGLL